ncbi:6664_t:CDS:2 [Ambispora gerdemannii]|uniref:6664_t:CDS:1 n=1 Tax=Ambispora gerdemannii TaxID=144530 RepID=A0A9N8WB16_9GLOM|nr:6664_t:CDS:2 [Ambispora gerdemannii]
MSQSSLHFNLPPDTNCLKTQCLCDFRLSIKDCNYKQDQDYTLLWENSYILVATTCFLVGFVQLIVLRYRIQRLKRRWRNNNTILNSANAGQEFHAFLIQKANNIGMIRPKPVETFLLLTALFNIIRGVDCVLVITNALSDYAVKEEQQLIIKLAIKRAAIFEIGWQFAFWGILCYLIGALYTIPHTLNLTRDINTTSYIKVWMPTPFFMDLFALFLVVGPISTLILFSVMSGLFANQGNFVSANFYRRVHYAFWVFYLLVMATGLLYFGDRLVKSIQSRIRHMKRSSSARDDKIMILKKAISNVKTTVICLASIVSFLSLISILYAIIREQIHKDATGNILFGLAWILVCPVSFGIATIGIIFGGSFTENITSSSIIPSKNRGSDGLVTHDSNISSRNTSKFSTARSTMIGADFGSGVNPWKRFSLTSSKYSAVGLASSPTTSQQEPPPIFVPHHRNQWSISSAASNLMNNTYLPMQPQNPHPLRNQSPPPNPSVILPDNNKIQESTPPPNNKKHDDDDKNYNENSPPILSESTTQTTPEITISNDPETTTSNTPEITISNDDPETTPEIIINDGSNTDDSDDEEDVRIEDLPIPPPRSIPGGNSGLSILSDNTNNHRNSNRTV